MRKRFLSAVLSAGLLFGAASPSFAVTHYRTYRQHIRHKRHVNTAKRVGLARPVELRSAPWPEGV